MSVAFMKTQYFEGFVEYVNGFLHFAKDCDIRRVRGDGTILGIAESRRMIEEDNEDDLDLVSELYAFEGFSPGSITDVLRFAHETYTEFNLAMAPGPHGRSANIENVLAGAAHFGLNAKQAGSVIHDVGANVGLWRTFFEKAGVSDEDTEKFRTTFESPQREKALSMLDSPVYTVGRRKIRLVTEGAIPSDIDSQVRHVVKNGLDPRTLEKTMPSADADKVREELRKAADNPEGWGVSAEAFEAWGKEQGIGRKRTVPTPTGDRTEIVYDDF